MKWAIGILAIAVLSALMLYMSGITAPGLLNLVDRAMPGASGAERVARDIAYGPATRQKLDVYRPHDAKGPLPVLVFFYGGAWNNGQRQDYGFAARAYASQGFLTILPDYRIVPEVRFPGFVEDGAAAVHWARDNAARLGGDPERIMLAGHSAGAYIAAMLALDPQWLDKADSEDIHIRAVAGLAGPYDFHPFTTQAAIEAFAGTPDPRATQPVNFARREAPPLWLASGSLDTVVKPRNSRTLAAAQARFGTVAEYREYEGLDHGDVAMALARPFRGKAPVLAESVAFLKKHAGSLKEAMDKGTATP